MTDRIITALLLVIAVIHLLPLSGLMGAEQLASLYGITISDTNLEILMRHRSILFGLLGAFFAYAALQPRFQPLAFVAAFVSIVSFLVLAFSIGEYNAAIQRVVIADFIALACLATAIALYFSKSRP